MNDVTRAKYNAAYQLVFDSSMLIISPSVAAFEYFIAQYYFSQNSQVHSSLSPHTHTHTHTHCLSVWAPKLIAIE